MQCNQMEKSRRTLERRVGRIVAMADISLSLRALAEWLRHHADILDAGLPERVNYGRPASERHRFVASHIDGLILRIVRLRDDLLPDLVDVHWFVVQVDSLAAVDRHHHSRLGQLFHGFVFGTSTSMPDCRIGAVIMKIISSTSTTSINGTMLISDSEVPVSRWVCGMRCLRTV